MTKGLRNVGSRRMGDKDGRQGVWTIISETPWNGGFMQLAIHNCVPFVTAGLLRVDDVKANLAAIYVGLTIRCARSVVSAFGRIPQMNTNTYGDSRAPRGFLANACTILCAAAFLGWLLGTKVLAQSVTYSGEGGSGSLQIYLGVQADAPYVYLPVDSTAEQITADPTALTIQLDELRINTGQLTTSYTESINTGFGRANDYTVTLTFAAQTIDMFGLGNTYALTPVGSGQYSFTSSNEHVFSPANILVDYSVQGPTQSASGTFDFPSYFDTAIGGSQGTAFLNTINYPTQLQSSAAFYSENNNVQTAPTVDGAQVPIQFGGVFPFTDVTMTPGSLAAVPEPSTYASIVGAAALGFAAIRRRRKTV